MVGKWYRHVLVHLLSLVVVFGMELTIGAGYGLGCLVGFKSQVTGLVLFGQLLLTQAVEAEHQVVVRLQVFRIDGQG